MNKYNYYN